MAKRLLKINYYYHHCFPNLRTGTEENLEAGSFNCFQFWRASCLEARCREAETFDT